MLCELNQYELKEVISLLPQNEVLHALQEHDCCYTKKKGRVNKSALRRMTGLTLREVELQLEDLEQSARHLLDVDTTTFATL